MEGRVFETYYVRFGFNKFLACQVPGRNEVDLYLHFSPAHIFIAVLYTKLTLVKDKSI